MTPNGANTDINVVFENAQNGANNNFGVPANVLTQNLGTFALDPTRWHALSISVRTNLAQADNFETGGAPDNQ